MPVTSLGYIRLKSPDLAGWTSFGADLLGMMLISGVGDDELQFRVDDFTSRLTVQRSVEPSLEAVGFQVLNGRDLAQVVARVEAAGIEVVSGTSDGAHHRHVADYVSFTDPAGAPIELFHSPLLQHDLPATPLVSGFVTGDLGLGHVVLTTPDLATSVEFYETALGFEERNTMPRPGGSLCFLSPNPRHHTIAFAERAGPPQLLHFMLEVAAMDDVGRAHDRIEDAGVQFVTTLGRHTNDRMVSFYVKAPDGFAVEFGWGGLEVREPNASYAISRPSVWGHRPVQQRPAGE